jgi:hypothetical protein
MIIIINNNDVNFKYQFSSSFRYGQSSLKRINGQHKTCFPFLTNFSPYIDKFIVSLCTSFLRVQSIKMSPPSCFFYIWGCVWFDGKKVEGKKLWKSINIFGLTLVQVHSLIFVIFFISTFLQSNRPWRLMWNIYMGEFILL